MRSLFLSLLLAKVTMLIPFLGLASPQVNKLNDNNLPGSSFSNVPVPLESKSKCIKVKGPYFTTVTCKITQTDKPDANCALTS